MYPLGPTLAVSTPCAECYFRPQGRTRPLPLSALAVHFIITAHIIHFEITIQTYSNLSKITHLHIIQSRATPCNHIVGPCPILGCYGFLTFRFGSLDHLTP